MMPLEQKTFENTVTKGEIAQDEQFLLLPQCFQLFSVIILPFIEIFHIFVYMFSAVYLVHEGKG